ncbi:hypothetical protein DXG03_005749 [Asterophora parasitica]|uniref:Uncharacterized protein n=1 Tax=Asterophora parasitica TaxID=117018 RepID=A0A9P7K7F0_9AGAR|nr:hypothetical protein DXG03_005749 [Asterophora parasitica]
MILDEKALLVMQPPPSYASSTSASSAGLPPFPSSARAPPPTLTSLPPHLLLHIIYLTFPQTPLPDQATIQRQRKTLYWMSVKLRVVDRTMYIACMHVLRSTHLPAYDALVRRPYSTDPFPIDHSPSAATTSPLNTLQRETSCLDRFIALKVREDVWADDSELHLERDEAYKDLFDLVQPRSRLEDLLREYGVAKGVVCVGAPPPPTKTKAPSSGSVKKKLPELPVRTPPTSPPSTSTSTSFISSLFRPKKPSSPTLSPTVSPFPPSPPSSHFPQPTRTPRRITPLPFHLLSISFSPRHVGVLLHSPSATTTGTGPAFAKRTIVSTPRARDETLEACARRLVSELRRWLEEEGG